MLRHGASASTRRRRPALPASTYASLPRPGFEVAGGGHGPVPTQAPPEGQARLLEDWRSSRARRLLQMKPVAQWRCCWADSKTRPILLQGHPDGTVSMVTCSGASPRLDTQGGELPHELRRPKKSATQARSRRNHSLQPVQNSVIRALARRSSTPSDWCYNCPMQAWHRSSLGLGDTSPPSTVRQGVPLRPWASCPSRVDPRRPTSRWGHPGD